MLNVLFLYTLLAATHPSQEVSPSIKRWCKDLSNELMSVSYDSCVRKPWNENTLTSKQGRPIPYLYQGNEKGRKILILGSIHGDEISSVSLAFRWLEALEKRNRSDFYFLFLPLVNPDGFYANPRTRTNAAGIDLNRNFKTSGWEEEAQDHWVRKARKDPRRFPGAKPASENETALVQKWIEDFKPELIISVHAPYGLVDHDGPVELRRDMKSPLPVRALGAFPGSLGKYAGLERKIPVVTVELGAAKKLPTIESIEDLLKYILAAKF